MVLWFDISTLIPMILLYGFFKPVFKGGVILGIKEIKAAFRYVVSKVNSWLLDSTYYVRRQQLMLASQSLT